MSSALLTPVAGDPNAAAAARRVLLKATQTSDGEATPPATDGLVVGV
jgi:hypothetical protein